MERRPRRLAARVTAAVAMLLVAIPASPGLPAASTGAPAPVAVASLGGKRLDSIAATAREAYVWGWPLAYVHQCRAQLEVVMFAGRSGGLPIAPINELAMLTDRVVPRSALVPCPNRDVLYGFGMFDLARSPVVLQVPDFGDRFWLYQLGDQRTDGFADLGSIHGTRPGCYLVVGPGWDGAVPEGITAVLRSPTRHAYCIPRIFFTSAEGDRAAAAASAAGVMAYPLADFTGQPQSRDWTSLRWLPSRSRDGHAVTPDRFLDILPELLDEVPPLPGEEALYARLHGLLTAIAANPALAAAAAAAVHEAERNVVAPLFHFRNVGVQLPAGGMAEDDADGPSNRIEAPAGEFSLYLRLYAPRAAALDGAWTPPPVVCCGHATLVAVDGPNRTGTMP